MQAGLIDVQSHSFWHPNFNQERAHLAQKEYRKFVDFQLQQSRDVLQQKRGVSIDMLAWPPREPTLRNSQ